MAYVKHDDVGTLIVLDTGVDLSETTSVEIIARDPSGTRTVLTGAVVETTKIRHVKTAATLDEVGDWVLEAHAVWGDSDLSGDPVVLEVYRGNKAT